MTEIGPELSNRRKTESSLSAFHAEIIAQLSPVPRTPLELETVSVSAPNEGQDRIERGRASEQLARTALQTNNFGNARQDFATAISLLEGQVPDVALMPLLAGQVRACLESNTPPSDRLASASTTQIQAALPHLQRLVTIGEANAAELDRQHPANRSENYLNLGAAQTRLRRHEEGAASFLRAIELTANNPGNNQYIRQLHRQALNNYIFCLQELPQTQARTQEIQRRRQELRNLLTAESP